ncbi:hypothetical protein LRP49_02110 [Enterovibrio sp. ZSDZ35]|uniref:Uncharacterized protein n=1 Tax=Enterovibrio qingdaonensis TaxID=2899818 RepID=A0ABT5QG70_9GAMM|nr:hypothetical protein [Enterovibrio sp. ZSDZ35]MDD1779981.1 hypothetical protein [Enterovibrio sp. ZSDZ35]
MARNCLKSSNKAVGLGEILLCCFLSFSSLNVSADANIEQVLDATEALNDNTEEILADAEKNVEEFGAILNKMEEVQNRTESALAAIRSVDFGKMASLAHDNARLGNLYIAEYQTYLNQVGEESTCYRPQVIGEFRDTVSKLKDYANRIPQLKAVGTEEDALLSIMELGFKSGSFFAVPSMFAVQTLCVVGDAEPIFEQFNAMEGDVVAGFLAHAMKGEGFEDGDIPPLPEDMMEMYEEDMMEMHEEEDDAWEPVPSRPISEITFSDPNIETCVKQSAEMFEAQMTDELPEVVCELQNGAAIVLDDLAQFQELKQVVLAGATIHSLAPLSGLPYLNYVVIENSVLSSVGDVSRLGGALLLSNTAVTGWSDFADSRLDTLNIEQPKDCRSLSTFLQNDSLIVTFLGTGQFETIGDIDGNGMRVVTECTKDSVF